jgi:DNA-3-methyladenine glycosylase
MPRLRKMKVVEFHRPAEELAEFLIGTILVCRIGPVVRRARIVETEAYVGPEDLACHTSRGRTARTEVMFGPPGRAYVYFVYGMHHMLNIVAGPRGGGQAVLVRAGEPLDGWEADLSGPGKLCRAMGITRAENGVDLTGADFYLTRDPEERSKIVSTARIGIDYARHWKDAPLRFHHATSGAVSGKKFSHR